MAIAGKVAITPGGEWSVDVAYDKLVIVTFGNNVYLSIKPSTGIEPTNEEYWMLLIENVTAEDLENIINGTTAVGNALQLGGKSASEYALVTKTPEQFSLGSSGTEAYYSMFARIPNNSGNSYTNATLLFSEGGNFGSAYTGVWLIQVSGRSSVPTMTIRTLIDSVDGSRPQFGYYNDTVNGYFYFGVKSTAYRGLSTVTNLGGSAFVEIKNFGNVTTEPTGWTKATAPVTATTADLANYLSRSGGTVENNGYTLTLKRTALTLPPYLTMENGSGVINRLTTEPTTKEFVRSVDDKNYTILDTGNKPSGTYTGNGSATARTINVGGFGTASEVCYIYNATTGWDSAIVFKSGAILIRDTTITSVNRNTARFENGELYIASDVTQLNANGNSYVYGVK